MRDNALRHWTRTLIATTALEDTLGRMLRGICRLLNEDGAVIWEYTDAGVIRRVAAFGLSEQLLAVAQARSQALPLDVHGAPRTVAALAPPWTIEWAEPEPSERISAVATAPLRSSHGVAGQLDVYRQQPHEFGRDELEVIEGFADIVGIALENARLREGMRSAVAELSAKEETLSNVVDHAGDGIVLLDEHWRILLWNPACARMTGWRADQVRGASATHYLCLHHCQDREHCQIDCPMVGIFEPAGLRTPYREAQIESREGAKRWVGASRSVSREAASGQPIGIVVLRDVTGAREVDEMKSSIVRLVSHELRTPLTSIRMLSELLVQHTFDASETREVAGDIARESTRLAQLIDGILEVARLAGGQVPLDLESVVLMPLVASAASLLARHSPQHDFTVDLPPDLPAVRGDPARIREILDNLLGNAVKYTPGGGAITVRAVENQAMVEISVTDEGPGIAPEERERLFDPFQRGAAAERTGVPGTGLGLHIATTLVERQGGRLWLEHTPGGGSTFTFSLPIDATASVGLT